MAGGAGTELVATGSDDGTVKIWEGGEDAGKHAVATFEVGCPVTAVAWSADGANVYIGAIDNEIHVSSLFFLSLIHLFDCENWLVGVRPSQMRTSVHPHRTQRYPHLPLPLSQWEFPPLSVLFIPNRYTRRAALLAIAITDT
jgi:WD40 repeat protein